MVPSNKKRGAGARTSANANECAVRALAKHWTDVEPGTKQYEDQRELLAKLCVSLGPDRFELFYDLREPKTDEERWSRDLTQGRISADEFGAKLKAHNDRPIDLPMLKAVHEYYVDRVGLLAKFLQAIVVTPSQRGQDHEEEATAFLEEAATKKSTLPSGNLMTVFEFLDEVRVEGGLGLAVLGTFEGSSAHWAAELMIGKTAEAWKSCRETAHRSETDPRYLYVASASWLFQQSWARRLPRPQTVYEQLRIELTRARMALKGRTESQTAAHHQHASRSPKGANAMADAAQQTVRVLLLASDPKDRGILRLSEELREIKEQTRKSKAVCGFDIQTETAVRPQDVQDALMRHTPHVVHFCGHANKDGKVVLEGPLGNSKPVEITGLAKVLKLAAADGLRAAVFNACDTQEQAKAAAKVLECAMGTSSTIDDKSAIVFAGAFYRAIAYGKDFARAVESGKADVAMQGYPDADSFLAVTDGGDPSKVYLSNCPGP